MKTVFISFHAKDRIHERIPGYTFEEIRDLADLAYNYGTDWASEPDNEISDFLMMKYMTADLTNREVKYFAGFVFVYSTTGSPALITLYEYKKS